MDNRSIFSKTGKGSLEIAKKMLKLSSEERQTLILIDGKSNYAELQEKLSRIQPVKLRVVFERLLELGLIREFVGKSKAAEETPDTSSAALPAGQPTNQPADDSEELDFTSLVPAASTSNDVAALRQTAAVGEQAREAALRDELAQSFAAGAAGATAAEEAARASREEAMRKVQAHKAAQTEAARVAAAQAAAQAEAQAEAARVAAAEADAARARAAEEQARAAAEQAAEQAAKQAAKLAAEQAHIKAEADRLAAEQRAREEKERQEREAAARLAAEEETQRKAESDARIKAEAERLVREQRAIQEQERLEREAAARAAAEEEARVKAEAERVAREQREREEATRRAAEEEAMRQAEEAARVKAEAERVAREQREREAATRRAAEEEARIKAEAERLAREQLEREEAARRAAEEAAKRKVEEEARIKAEAERLAREQLEREAKEQREREAAAQRAAEEEARQKAEAARRAAEEEARIKAEAERLAREQMEREDQEQREREEAPKRAAEEAARRVAEEEARKAEEAARLKAEEAARLKAEDDARLKAEAEAQKKAEAERQAQQARERAEKERTKKERADREHAEREAAEKQAAAAAAAATAAAAASAAALLSQQAAATAATAAAAPATDGSDLDSAPVSDEQRRNDEVAKLLAGAATSRPDGTTPLTGGGPDTFADTGPEIDPFADDGTKSGQEQEQASRREIEQEARDRADARAEPVAAQASEHDTEPAYAQAPAKERRSGGGLPIGLPIGKIIGAVAALVLVGAIGYVFMMPVDKPGIERALSERLGEPVTVDAARVSPFSAALTLTGVNIGAVKLNSVAASTDFSALFSAQKIWKSVDISGLSIDAAAARSLITLGAREVPKTAAGKVQIQRLHITDMEISGLPVATPKFNAEILFTSAGTLKKITLATADNKARAILQPEEKGWIVDIESKGVTWPAGPKIAWESVRAKGIGSANGIKFDDYTITHFGGVSRGSGELVWNNGWKFNGNLDAGAMESEAIAQAFFEATPVSGTIEGKLSISMSSPSLARLFETPQIDGALSVSKAILKTVDLARTAQTGATAQGSTRFTDFSTTLAVAGGRVQLKDLKGVSGLLTVTGNAQLDAAKNVSGGLLVELGVGGSRAKANVKLSGTMAEPKLAK